VNAPVVDALRLEKKENQRRIELAFQIRSAHMSGRNACINGEDNI
jgi:hypothetical protein